MQPFEFFMGSRVIFGRGKLDTLSEVAGEFDGRALLVTGKGSMKSTGVLDRVQEGLGKAGKEYTLFEGVEENPSAETVDRGATTARDAECSFIVGLGGGSALDAAKAIAVAVSHDGSIWEYVEGGPEPKPITPATLPLLLIPSTSGTGSETSPYSVITNREMRVKDTLVSPHLYPRAAIVDPLLAASMGPELTAATGMDAFCHALEGYTSRFSQPLTDLVALDALERVIRSLPRAVACGDDAEARDDLAWAATLAGMVIGQTGCTLVHAMSHPVSANFPISHGTACALLTPAVVQFGLRSDLDKYAHLASLFGLDIEGIPVMEAAREVVPLIEEFLVCAGFQKSLGEMGMQEEALPELAEGAVNSGAFGCNKLSPSAQEVADLFRRAMHWTP